MCRAGVGALYIHDPVKNAAVTTYTDNQGVLGTVVAGGSRCPVQNNMTAQMWWLMAEECTEGD